ncbi:MAG TPA: PQQ-binding-like beta-propeller repeat protein, partial [Planctomycetota bacterium]|nr:PQQ-binding-like beta-propeller repeat protein [Planctomycetota bacterium]
MLVAASAGRRAPWGGGGLHADWPTVRGGPERTGYSPESLPPPFRVDWIVHAGGQRMSSALEPVVSDGRVFVATHRGNILALDAASGRGLWRARLEGAILHSPAVARGIVVAASTAGVLAGVDAAAGTLRWSTSTGRGGCSSSPLILESTVCIGTRAGELLGVHLEDGGILWRRALGAPVRQTAAGSGRRVFVTAEDLRVWCVDAATGDVAWTSEQLEGQSARDYFPVLARAGDRTIVVVRTSPSSPMSERIARDRRALARSAGLDDGDWKTLDAWTKRDGARGRPELWAREEEAIGRLFDEE